MQTFELRSREINGLQLFFARIGQVGLTVFDGVEIGFAVFPVGRAVSSLREGKPLELVDELDDGVVVNGVPCFRAQIDIHAELLRVVVPGARFRRDIPADSVRGVAFDDQLTYYFEGGEIRSYCPMSTRRLSGEVSVSFEHSG